MDTLQPARLDPEVLIICSPHDNPVIRAKEMALGEYLELREWARTADVSPDSPGYLIEKQGYGPPNHEEFQGIIAWLPQDKFDRLYERLGTLNS